MTTLLGRLSRVSLALMLLTVAAWAIVKPSIDQKVKEGEKAVSRVVTKGPVVNKDIEWRLDSLREYTRLVKAKDQSLVKLDVPAGATIVVAEMTIKALGGAKVDDDGFTCTVELRDDRGNIWAEQSVSGTAPPTTCTDYDKPMKRDKAGAVMKVFIVPKSAVPHLLGVVTPPKGSNYREERVLIRP